MRKKIIKTLFITTKFSVYWLAFVLLITGIWLKKNFGEPNFEQIIYHLQFGSEGLVETDPLLIRSFIKNCLILPALLALILFLYERFIFLVNSLGLKQALTQIKMSLKLIFWAIFNILYKISMFAFRIKLPITLLVLSAIFFLSKVAFWTYLKNRGESSFIAENYVTPQAITSPAHKKNLVLIYAESLENTYSNRSIFGEDLLNSLNDKTIQATTFKNFRQATGTGWTIAGIVSSQCGIPLKSITLYDGNRHGENIKNFLPGVVCLGDILKKEGYKNIYMGGDTLSFSGKGKFFQQHGYTELYGREEWENLGEKNLEGWGLQDDLLLTHAKKKITQLEKDKIPYNLTITTIDTHGPVGTISATCKRKGVKEFTGIVKCTSDILADFIAFMAKNNYLKNTNIVILGDHLSMVNPVYEKLLIEKNRTIFNRFITIPLLKKNRDDIYHFSIFPTILYSMDFRFEKNRLGLGASGFGELDPNFSLIPFDETELSPHLAKSSKKYLEFWKIKK